MIVDCNSPKSVARLDCVPAHCLSFSIFFLILLIVQDLVLEILLIVTVNIEVFLLQYEETVAKLSFLEVDKPLRVKCISLISGLEMEVRTC